MGSLRRVRIRRKVYPQMREPMIRRLSWTLSLVLSFSVPALARDIRLRRRLRRMLNQTTHVGRSARRSIIRTKSVKKESLRCTVLARYSISA